MNIHQHKMLRCIATAPRDKHYFTEGSLQQPARIMAHPIIVEGWLEEMVRDGFARKDGALYCITTEGRREHAKKPAVAPSIQYGNASTTEPYVPSRMGSCRPGADQHRQYRSLGN